MKQVYLLSALLCAQGALYSVGEELIKALEARDMGAVRQLLHAGSNPDACRSNLGNTVLQYCCQQLRKGCVENERQNVVAIARMSVAFGASFEGVAAGYHQEYVECFPTPFEQLTLTDQVAQVQQMINHAYDTIAPFGARAMQYAIGQNHEELVKLMRRRGLLVTERVAETALTARELVLILTARDAKKYVALQQYIL